MKKIILLIGLFEIAVISNSQDLSQTNCEACYQTVNAAFAPNMARLFNYTNTADIKESFKSWFFSEDFERYTKSSSTGLSIPIFDDILKFSNDSKSDWEKRKVLKSKKSLDLDDHFFTKFWSLNPDVSMASEFNRALQSCNESPCQGDGNDGRTVFLGKVVKTENSVIIPFNFPQQIDNPVYPVIADIFYDKNIFSFDEKKWINKPIKRTNSIVLNKKPGTKWPRSFFGIDFKNGLKGITYFIDGETTPGYVTYEFLSDIKIPSCFPYNEGVSTNEGNHDNYIGNLLRSPIGTRFKDYTNGNGEVYEQYFANSPVRGQPSLLLQRTLPILSDGRKYKNIQLAPQGESDPGVSRDGHVETFIDYYENGVIKPGLTESNQARVRVYDASKWYRFSVFGQICSYADQRDRRNMDVVFDANNTARVDLPACLSATLLVQKNGINYTLDLLNPANSTSNVPVHNVLDHFTITPPKQGQHVYTVLYRY